MNKKHELSHTETLQLLKQRNLYKDKGQMHYVKYIDMLLHGQIKDGVLVSKAEADIEVYENLKKTNPQFVEGMNVLVNGKYAEFYDDSEKIGKVDVIGLVEERQKKRRLRRSKMTENERTRDEVKHWK